MAGLIATPGCFPRCQYDPLWCRLITANTVMYTQHYSLLSVSLSAATAPLPRVHAATLLLLHQHRCPNSMSIIPFLND